MYTELIKKIDREGAWTYGKEVRPKWSDGTTAHSKAIFFHTMTFNPDELPILTLKNNFPVTAMKEMFWIWKYKSNNVNDLRKINGTEKTVWNEWERDDHTIGKAYGYQLSKEVMKLGKINVDQVDYILYNLRYNSGSRRILTELWNIDDLSDMSLTPCVHHTQWDTYDGNLNLLVKARSSDVGLGLPFNVYQYAILHRMVARHANFPLGKMHFVLGNAHIYDRHIEQLRKVIKRKPLPAPEINMNPIIENFYDFTINDIKLINYNYHCSIKLEVAE